MSNIEEHIRKAMEEGKFDKLPGKGKPLHMNENPFEDPGWQMANHMLKDGGFTLPWIEKRAEIDSLLETARQGLSRSWQWRLSALESDQPARWVEAEWQKAVQAFREQVTAINKKIFSYNLEVPLDRFQILTINAERELEAVTKAEG